MNKEQAISELSALKKRLHDEVVKAYGERGTSFGDERFKAWRRKLTAFLSANLPGQVAVLDGKLTHYAVSFNPRDSDLEHFWKQDGATMEAYVDSLIIDIQNDEFESAEEKLPQAKPKKPKARNMSKVFIVHGHDGEAKLSAARFVERLGFEAIILHEQPNQGHTIIEKIEKHSEVGFAIVLYTPDDLGNTKAKAEKGEFNSRARQNVVFEHGYLIAKLGRSNVAALVAADIELPSDINGVVYISQQSWQVDLAKEMKAAGYSVDFNRIL